MPSNDPPFAADWIARRRRLESILRLQAATVIGDPGLQEAVRVLAEAVGDPDGDVRELATAALSEFGPEARPALPALLRACQDENRVVRRRAVRAIGFIGPIAAEDALPSLVAATEDEEDGVALQAMASLGEFESASAPAVPALMAALWTGDARRRAVAGVALIRIGSAAVEALVQSLSHPAPEVRAKSAQLLGKIGPAAAEARSALQLLQNDPDDQVRAQVADSLRALGS